MRPGPHFLDHTFDAVGPESDVESAGGDDDALDQQAHNPLPLRRKEHLPQRIDPPQGLAHTVQFNIRVLAPLPLHLAPGFGNHVGVTQQSPELIGDDLLDLRPGQRGQRTGAVAPLHAPATDVTAFLTATPLRLAPLTGARDAAGSEGPLGDFSITNFSRSEPLEEGVTVSVTAKLAVYDSWVKVTV